jgi:2-dehydro-3-deoxygluconokinase
MQAARQAGAIVSFDLNYREKLWRASGGVDRAPGVFARIVEHVDVLVGNEEDLQKALGVKGPDVGAASSLDTSAFFATIDEVVKRYPRIKVVGTTLREVLTTNRHTWSAVAWINGERVLAPTCQLDVYDRVGGGDGFASGLFYGLMTGASPEEAVRLGWAHGALITTYPGDTTMATIEDVRAFAKGGSARIQR